MLRSEARAYTYIRDTRVERRPTTARAARVSPFFE